MKCHNCGREIGDFTAFCTYCGASTGNQPAESSQITDPGKTDEPAETLPGYSEPFEQTGREAPPPLYNVNRQENPQIDLIPEHNRTQTTFVPDYEDEYMNGTSWPEISRMGHIIGVNGRFCTIKWLKINMYFLLFAWAAMDAIRAVLFFSGLRYGGAASWVYEIFPQVFTMDTVMGIFLTISAGAKVFLWISISELRRRSLWLCFAIPLAGFLAEVVYISRWCSVMGSAAWDAIVYVAFLALVSVFNFIYFRYRSTVFTR